MSRSEGPGSSSDREDEVDGGFAVLSVVTQADRCSGSLPSVATDCTDSGGDDIGRAAAASYDGCGYQQIKFGLNIVGSTTPCSHSKKYMYE